MSGVPATYMISCLKKMVGSARLRAKKKKIPFDAKYMTWQNMVALLVEQEGRCFESGRGVTFDAGDRRKNFDKVSPDQIVAGKGYVQGNVRLLTFGANSMKNDMSEAEFHRYCYDVYATNRKRSIKRGRAKSTKAKRRSNGAKASRSARR